MGGAVCAQVCVGGLCVHRYMCTMCRFMSIEISYEYKMTVTKAASGVVSSSRVPLSSAAHNNKAQNDPGSRTSSGSVRL